MAEFGKGWTVKKTYTTCIGDMVIEDHDFIRRLEFRRRYLDMLWRRKHPKVKLVWKRP